MVADATWRLGARVCLERRSGPLVLRGCRVEGVVVFAAANKSTLGVGAEVGWSRGVRDQCSTRSQPPTFPSFVPACCWHRLVLAGGAAVLLLLCVARCWPAHSLRPCTSPCTSPRPRLCLHTARAHHHSKPMVEPGCKGLVSGGRHTLAACNSAGAGIPSLRVAVLGPAHPLLRVAVLEQAYPRCV